ncbi:MAG: methyltransferase domain-containing protein [Myxococcales bacterium]|nr:methyltransferase domain-containing protein [Myxococcales bacterium]
MKHLAALTIVTAACARPSPEPTTASAMRHPHHAPHSHDAHPHHHGAGHFQDPAQWARIFDDPARDAVIAPDRVIAAMALAPSMTVVDLGAGTGYFSVRLARAVPAGRVIATDIEAPMLRYIEARAQREGLNNLSTALGTEDSPGLAPGSVDRVLVVDVWHHVAHRVAYARRLAEALTPDGRVFIVETRPDAEVEGPPPAMRLRPETICQELAEAGFEARALGLSLAHHVVVEARRAQGSAGR